MNIAHVVVDLPIEGHFDYLIPDDLIDKAIIGVRVKIVFGTKSTVGFIVGLAQETTFDKIKPIKDIYDATPIVNAADLIFAKQFCQYYGCSLGEALALIVRHRRNPPIEQPSRSLGKIGIHHCPDGQYLPVITALIEKVDLYHILVPDGHVANGLNIPKSLRPRVGLRSSMFEAFLKNRLIIVIDEDNPSFKQEQSPMYQTRDVVLMAQHVYGFDVAFVGATPSVELMHLVKEKKALYTYYEPAALKKSSIIDLTNYKFLDKGVLSPPVRNCCQNNINAKKITILLLNRRGSFSITRCRECANILKCPHCDAPLAYERNTKQYKCRLCSFVVSALGSCSSCHKNNWQSFGLGVDGLQKELQQLFPTARIVAFEANKEGLPPAGDIIIATSAILRFRSSLTVNSIICVDLDTELNRTDIRSSFHGWSMMMHLRQMTQELLVQTRNRDHFVFKSLASDDPHYFYNEELALRKELGFTPFYHWLAVRIRSKTEKIADTAAQAVYNKLIEMKSKGVTAGAPEADTPAKVRDQFRFKVMVGSLQVQDSISVIKHVLAEIKRSRVIITLDIDP